MSSIIRWEFTRGRERVSCQVDRQGEDGTRAAFAVALVPVRNRGDQWRETCTGVAPALRRHAMLASALRESGWKLVAYTR